MARLDEFDSKVVSTAATEIISTLAAQAAELVPQIRKAYKLDDQLVNLVLAAPGCGVRLRQYHKWVLCR